MISLSISNDITRDYVRRVISFNELPSITAKFNYSASSFRGGYRSKETLDSLGDVAIYDFDDGSIGIAELVEFLSKNLVTSIITTSKSHMKEKGEKPACERFRLFVLLSDKISVKPDEYPEFLLFLAKILRIDEAIDKATRDVARFFYPNPNQEVFKVLTGWVLDTKVLQDNFYELMADIFEEKKARANSAALPSKQPIKDNGKIKRNEVPRDTQIELKGGVIKSASEFEYLQGDETVSCRCINPSHEDRNPSAFIGRSRSGGGLQITCKGCGYNVFVARV